MTDGTRTAVEKTRERAPGLARDTGRVIVERVWPEIDGGRFPIKRTVGERVTVSADIFADGHDLIAGVVKYRYRGPEGSAPQQPRQGRGGSSDPPSPDPPSADEWQETPLTPLDNDRWEGAFTVTELGAYEYTLDAWIDRFGSWLKGLGAKAEAGQDVSSELLEGAELIQQAVGRHVSPGPKEPGLPSRETDAVGQVVSAFAEATADRRSSHASGGRLDPPADNLRLLEIADVLRSNQPPLARLQAARDPSLRALMDARPDRSASTTYERALTVVVDPIRARFGAWYEMFPRSCTSDPRRSGTFREAESRLPDIAAMGFDVVYLPPVHPIGTTHRKGRNNSLIALPDDPGSPWAIGSRDGGHTAIDPGLGTIDDFDRFVDLANRLGLEVALDIAFQASPDHPWVEEHPAWFRHRPDGSIKYAENPPKKYQDIYPFDLENADWQSLWAALRDVLRFWIAHGVRIFRVDNPHTKALRFWEWAIAEIRREQPDAIFLAEAFTRPKVMRYLAKAGFTQSYTYFTWRNSPYELREYLTELTRTELQEYMRPNFFANTPDILHEYLQTGGRPAFEVRLILAATLAANYGIYSGFELCENAPIKPGSEEYFDSEKYQIKPRDWNQAGTLRELIARVNQIRHDYAALQQNATLAFHSTDNPHFLFFSKTNQCSGGSRGSGARVFIVVSTDPHWTQQGWVQMPIWETGITGRERYVVEDLLDGGRYTWRGEWNYVKLDPSERVAHIFVIRDW
jgi:starch synthase (maltosyl-transferring)